MKETDIDLNDCVIGLHLLWSEACSGISRSPAAHFAVAEVLTWCWQEKVEEGNPGVPVLGGAGRGYKAHCCCSCCCCCCWLQVDLLVTTGHADEGPFLPWSGYTRH